MNKVILVTQIIIVFILISLNILVILHGRNLSCDKCVFTLTSWQKPAETNQMAIKRELNVNITEIAKIYALGKCPIAFNEDRGFYVP